MDIENVDTSKEIVINTLKAFSSLVFEISRDEVFTGVWAADTMFEEHYRNTYIGKKLVDIRNDTIISVTQKHVQRAFETGEQGLIEYKTDVNRVPARILIRVFPAPYNKDYVINTIETVKKTEQVDVTEDKWRIALDASGDGIWDANMQTGKIFFSPKWHEIFGYDENEITKTSEWSEKIHLNDLAGSQKNFDDYLAGKAPSYSAEVRYRCKDGSYRWILSRGIVAATDDDGKPVRFIGTHTDIHQRKLQELQIEESEKKYRILFDYSEAMICTHDLEGKLISVNPFITKALGYIEEELIGSNLADLIPQPFSTRFREDYLRIIREQGSAEGLLHILNKQGETKTLLFKNYLFSDVDNHPYVIGFAQDISARIKMEEQLKNSVDTFSSAFRHSGIGMALISPDGRLLEVNEALCRMTDYTPDELLKLTFRDITHPDDVGQHMSLKQQLLDKEIDTFTFEKRYVAKTGRIIWATLTCSLVWNKNGSPKFFISQIEDITARKELTNELHEKNLELERAKNSLTIKVSQLEELSYIIAHNLRGPARNINFLIHVLKKKQGEEEDASEEVAVMSEALTVREAISMLGDAGASLINSLESLLNIAEIRLNKNIPFDLCSFDDIMRDIISQLKGDIVEKKVQIDTDFTVERIYYPKPYLESILYNLVSNAIKYRNPAVPPRILVTTQQVGTTVKLSVEDNGLGIDLEKYGHKVFKLNQVFHSNQDSKGIGLYMIKTQIESLGGSIGLQSKVNEGSEFVVSFDVSHQS